MFKIKPYGIVAIPAILAIIFSSCENKKITFREIRVSTAPYIHAVNLDLKRFSINLTPEPSSIYTLDIVIYGYSQGKETISMDGVTGFQTETGSAKIKALVKIMDGEKIVRAEFVEVSGSSNDELILNLSKSVKSLSGE